MIKIEQCRDNGVDLMQLDERTWAENKDAAKAAITQFIFDVKDTAQ